MKDVATQRDSTPHKAPQVHHVTFGVQLYTLAKVFVYLFCFSFVFFFVSFFFKQNEHTTGATNRELGRFGTFLRIPNMSGLDSGGKVPQQVPASFSVGSRSSSSLQSSGDL